MTSSNCCFLTCIQVSQQAGQVVWYSHLLQNVPQFTVIHTIQGFGIVNKTEIDVFWNSLAISMIQQMLGIWPLVSLPFLKPAWTSGSSLFTCCWSLAGRIVDFTLLVWTSLGVQTVNCLPAMRETRVQSLGREDLLEKEMATHSSILAWKIPWMEEPGRL